MDITLIERLRCPVTGQRLHLRDAAGAADVVDEGWLDSEDGQHSYPIRRGIPRFVPPENYAGNFGLQWNHFRKTQLDSQSGHPISTSRFRAATGWQPQDMAGRWVLDAGCGAGRFAEVALASGANVVALDYSDAVDACLANLGPHPRLHVVQGDIFALPFARRSFDFVYSLGVIQHTPDPGVAFASLPAMVAPGGHLCVDVYERTWKSALLPKYLLRPLVRRVPKPKLLGMLKRTVPPMLTVSRALGAVPGCGLYLRRVVPVMNYEGILPLNEQQLREWALLDTFDMFGPEYDAPQTRATLRKWLEDADIRDIEIFKAGHLVGRGVVSDAHRN